MSADPFLTSQLAAVPLFSRLSPDQLTLLAQYSQRMTFEQGALVFAQGQPTQGALLLTSGRAVLTQATAAGEQVIDQVLPGQLVNESALFRAGVENANVRIVESATCIFISRTKFQHLLSHAPGFNVNLVQNAPAAAPRYSVNHIDYGEFAGAPELTVQTASAPDGSPSAPTLSMRGQRFDESVLYIFRPHWWMIGRYVWIPIAIVAGAVLLGLLIGRQASLLGLTVAGIGIIVAGLLTVYGYTEWRDDALYVTDQRLLHVRNFIVSFQQKISEVPLERVSGVTWSVPPLDIMARLFNYGTVNVQSTSEATNLVVGFIQQPERIQKEIFAVRDRVMQNRSQRNQADLHAQVSAAIGLEGSQAAAEAVAPQPSQPQFEPVTPDGPFFARTRFMGKGNEIVYRRHWTTWLSHVALPSLLITAVLVFAAILYGQSQSISTEFVTLLVLIGISIGLVWLYLADWDWRNDLFIVGTETITIIHRRPLFIQNEIDRVRMVQVDSVVSEIRGPINTLLDRGNVRISLVGSDNVRVFTQVKDPVGIQLELSRRQESIKRTARESQAESQQEAALRYLQAYHELTQAEQQAAAPVAFTQPSRTVPGAPPGISFNPATQPNWRSNPTMPAPPAAPTVPHQPPPPPSPPASGDRPPRIST